MLVEFPQLKFSYVSSQTGRGKVTSHGTHLLHNIFPDAFESVKHRSRNDFRGIIFPKRGWYQIKSAICHNTANLRILPNLI